jgi:hypothetical protein
VFLFTPRELLELQKREKTRKGGEKRGEKVINIPNTKLFLIIFRALERKPRERPMGLRPEPMRLPHPAALRNHFSQVKRDGEDEEKGGKNRIKFEMKR